MANDENSNTELTHIGLYRKSGLLLLTNILDVIVCFLALRSLEKYNKRDANHRS